MKYSRRRLDNLLQGLTARERALLILRALRNDERPDIDIVRTVPRQQREELNFYLFLIGTVNESLSPVILYLEQELSQLELLLGQMDLHRLRVSHVLALAEYISLCTKEPITESDYRRLAGSGKSRRKSLRPYWGSGYDVFPDNEAEKVRRLLHFRQGIGESLQGLPVSLVLGVPFPENIGEGALKGSESEEILVWPIVRDLRRRIPSVSRDLQAVERLIEMVRGSLDGKDPAHPDMRRRLKQCKKRVDSLKERAEKYLGALALPEPEGNELGVIGRTVEEVVRRCERQDGR